jgi:hypothetical protein
MADPDFEATWLPRIGPEATQKLWTYNRFLRRGFLWALFPVGAGVLIGSGWLGDVVGGMCAAAMVVSWLVFVYTQRRTAIAISHWRGFEIRWLPRMTPENFDRLCQRRGVPQHGKPRSESETQEPALFGSQSPGQWPDEAGIARWRRKRAEKLDASPSSDLHPDD